MTHAWRYALLFVLGAASTASASESKSEPRVVQDTTILVPAAEGADSLLARRITFTHAAESAVVDSTTGVLLVTFPATIEGGWQSVSEGQHTWRTMAYDLSERRVLWSELDDATPVAMVGKNTLLASNKGSRLVRTRDRHELVDLPGRLRGAADDAAIVVDEDFIARYDIASGERTWQVHRGIGGSAPKIVRAGKIAFLLGDGLQMFDMETGAGWSYAMAASRSSTESPSTQGIFSAPDLHTMIYGKDIHALLAEPAIYNDRVYFAAQTTVVCLDLVTGKAIWTSELKRDRGFSLAQRAMGGTADPEFPGRLNLTVGKGAVYVASLGWAEGNKTYWKADPPSVAVLSKADGKVVRRVQVPKVDIISDIRASENGVDVLSSEWILSLDDSLRVIGSVRPGPRFQPLLSFMPQPKPEVIAEVIPVASAEIVVLGSSGVIGISRDSMRVSWQRLIGHSTWVETAPYAVPVIWLFATEGFAAFDPLRESRPGAFYRLRNHEARLCRHTVVAISGGQVTVLLLPFPREAPRPTRTGLRIDAPVRGGRTRGVSG